MASSVRRTSSGNIDNSTRKRLSSESENVCVLCCENIEFYAVGPCDHPVCFRCSARMRVLAKQNYCAVCRADINEVLFLRDKKNFRSLQINSLLLHRKYRIRFEDQNIEEEFFKLLDNVCPECGPDSKAFGAFADLKNHIRKVHEKQYCQICVDNLMIFNREFQVYTKKDLITHRRAGDNKSYSGHPDCRFCDERFFDNDALLLHLRKNHFWCHFCEKDGKQDYYNVYLDLRKHFDSEHYLCNEGACKDEKYTCVFRNDIDLQSHRLVVHAKNLNKMQAKEARKLELGFDYGPRPRQGPRGIITGEDYEETHQDHGRGRDRNQRRDGAARFGRGHRGTIDYREYEDIEHEREMVDVKKKEMQAKTKERVSKNNKPDPPKNNKPDPPKNNKPDHPRNNKSDAPKNNKLDASKYNKSSDSSPDESPSEPQVSRMFDDEDDDVIGIPIHINRDSMPSRKVDSPVDSPQPRKRATENPTPSQPTAAPEKSLERMMDADSRSPPSSAKNSPKTTQKNSPKPTQKNFNNNKSDDFPSLSTNKFPEEKFDDFPSLGQPGVVKKPPTFDDFPTLGNAKPVDPPPKKLTPEEEFPTLGEAAKSAAPAKQAANNSTWMERNGAPAKSKQEGMSKQAKKGKGKSWLQQTGREKMLKDDDFPTLGGAPKARPPGLSGPPPNVNTSAKQKPPGLQSGTSTKLDKPPPGIHPNNSFPAASSMKPGHTATSSKSSKPPGLVQNGRPSNKPPPGLSNGPKPNGPKPGPTPLTDAERAAVDQQNKLDRNRRLLIMLQSFLDEFNMTLFKNLSGDFRRGTKTAQEYYNGISELLGPNLKTVFSELVDLLPDPTKQEQLLQVHNDAKIHAKQLQELAKDSKANYARPKVWGGSPSPKAQPKKSSIAILPHGQAESQCRICGVTFPTEKSIEHMELHKDNAFPSLPVAVQKKKDYSFMPARTSKNLPIKNAWGK